MKNCFCLATKEWLQPFVPKMFRLFSFRKDWEPESNHITPEHCDFLSIDWQTSLPTARELVHQEVGLQGNIDPRLLFAPQEEIEKTLESYIEFGSKNQNWIFNLGHGFIPGLPYENANSLPTG